LSCNKDSSWSVWLHFLGEKRTDRKALKFAGLNRADFPENGSLSIIQMI